MRENNHGMSSFSNTASTRPPNPKSNIKMEGSTVQLTTGDQFQPLAVDDDVALPTRVTFKPRQSQQQQASQPVEPGQKVAQPSVTVECMEGKQLVDKSADLVRSAGQNNTNESLLAALKVFVRFALICCEGLWYHLAIGVLLGLGELPFLFASGVYVFYTSTIDYSCSSREWWYDALIYLMFVVLSATCQYFAMIELRRLLTDALKTRRYKASRSRQAGLSVAVLASICGLLVAILLLPISSLGRLLLGAVAFFQYKDVFLLFFLFRIGIDQREYLEQRLPSLLAQVDGEDGGDSCSCSLLCGDKSQKAPDKKKAAEELLFVDDVVEQPLAPVSDVKMLGLLKEYTRFALVSAEGFWYHKGLGVVFFGGDLAFLLAAAITQSGNAGIFIALLAVSICCQYLAMVILRGIFTDSIKIKDYEPDSERLGILGVVVLVAVGGVLAAVLALPTNGHEARLLLGAVSFNMYKDVYLLFYLRNIGKDLRKYLRETEALRDFFYQLDPAEGELARERAKNKGKKARCCGLLPSAAS